MHILETMNFPKKHTIANICVSLLNARTDFGVWSKSAKGKIPQSEGAMSSGELAYLARNTSLHAPVLMSDCGSDVLVGSDKDSLLDCNHYAYHCLSVAVQAAVKSPALQKFCTSCICKAQ